MDTFFMGFIDFMSKGLWKYTNSFAPNGYKNNDKIIVNILNNCKLHFLWIEI